jgi:hypothetical protein
LSCSSVNVAVTSQLFEGIEDQRWIHGASFWWTIGGRVSMVDKLLKLKGARQSSADIFK